MASLPGKMLFWNGGTMKKICKLLWGVFLLSCSSNAVDVPEEHGVTLNMFTEGAGNFSDYVQTLAIYAFRLTSDGDYVYDRTLADLMKEEIEALENVSGRGNAKYYKGELAVGTYELYFVGNAARNIAGEFRKGVSRPEDISIIGNGNGQDSVYFLGKLPLRVVADYIYPYEVTLNRVVSKVILVLDGVPAQVASIQLTLENVASSYNLSGGVSSERITVEKTFINTNTDVGRRDTVVYELLTLPTTGTRSPFSLTFTSRSGVEKVKEMPSLLLLPDKYFRLSGTINDAPGALLSFDMSVTVSIFDKWGEDKLPDFTVKPSI